jgi:hypothetical protein
LSKFNIQVNKADLDAPVAMAARVVMVDQAGLSGEFVRKAEEGAQVGGVVTVGSAVREDQEARLRFFMSSRSLKTLIL